MYSDLLKEVKSIGTSNQSALFPHIILMLKLALPMVRFTERGNINDAKA